MTTVPKERKPSLRRVEDDRLLRGRGRFIDDLRFPDLLHAGFLRSPHAHALIRSVDVTPARAADGVADAFDGASIGRWCRPIRAIAKVPGFIATDWPVLATDRVRFVGEAVALVVAADRYVAEDAAELIDVVYEPLPPIVDAEAAMLPDPPLVHPDAGTNVLFRRTVRSGDVDGAMAAADLVMTEHFDTQRVTALPIETRGCVAIFDRATDRLTLWSSTQVPHIARTGLAEFLEMDESRIRVVSPDVGGGFGAKGQLTPEEIAVCVASRVLGRPVKWTEDRREHLLASIHAREHRYHVEAAVRSDGRLLALRARVVTDMGAYSVYPYTVTGEAGHAASLLPGAYDLQNYECDAFSVVTNKCPVAPVRGVSRPPTNFVTERIMDLIARRLDLDPMEVRLRNLIRDDQFPYRTAPGVVFDSGQYGRAVQMALDAVDYSAFRREQQRAWDDGRFFGVGLSIYVETSGGSSTGFLARGLDVAGFDMARVRVLPSATVEVLTSASSTGQSHETVFGKLVADALCIPSDRVVVREGDTDLVPMGTGSFGSRSAVVSGGAALIAAKAVREKAIGIAAHLLGTSPSAVVLGPSGFAVRDDAERTLTWLDVARSAHFGAGKLPAEIGPGLEATAVYDLPPGQTPCSYGVHVAIVEVDADTGFFSIRRYVVVEDCGTMLDQAVVDGQVLGALAQGIGTAAYEAHVYDENGQLLTGSLMDYLAPTAMEIPAVEILHLCTPSPYTVTGAKGMGEGAAVAPPAALANAICDALRPLGVEISSLPLAPERIRRAIVGSHGRLADRASDRGGARVSGSGRIA